MTYAIVTMHDAGYRDLPGDDPKQRQPDTTLAKTLGWQPTVELRDGLVETIKYFKGK